MSDPARIVSCPNCGVAVKWTPQNKYRPFCSERCKLIDFGGWANESNRIPGDGVHEDINSQDLEGEG